MHWVGVMFTAPTLITSLPQVAEKLVPAIVTATFSLCVGIDGAYSRNRKSDIQREGLLGRERSG